MTLQEIVLLLKKIVVGIIVALIPALILLFGIVLFQQLLS